MEHENQYRQAQRPKYDCLLFDDTLNPLSSGLAAGCLKNIGDYMVEKLGINRNKIPDLCNLLYKNYGITMAGLRDGGLVHLEKAADKWGNTVAGEMVNTMMPMVK